MLEAQSEKIAELEGKLNEDNEKNQLTKKENDKLTRGNRSYLNSTGDLADTEIEKFKSLTEDVEFTDEESFKEKLDTLKESYFPKTKKVRD